MEVKRKYNTSAKILFPLITKGAPDFLEGATLAAGDATISKDEGAFASTTNTIVDEGNGWYSLTLTSTEMQAARIMLSIRDQTDPKEWEDQAIAVETYGHASANITFDFSQATPAVNVTQFGGSNLTASGGRPEVNVSHFGGSAGTFSGGRPEVNSSHISGSATAADNAEIVFSTDFASNYNTTADRWNVSVTHYGGTAGTFASGRPETNMTHIAGSSVSTTTAQLGVNVVQISGDATAADNCELMFDGTGYAGGTAKLGVDIVSISGDSVAADRLETMLDGTGGNTLSLGALTITGAMTVQGGVTITNSTGNGSGLSITGNGTGYGIVATGGSSNGAGMRLNGGATNGDALILQAAGSGNGFSAYAPGAGIAFNLQSNTGDAVNIVTGGDNGIIAVGNVNGAFFYGGNSGLRLEGEDTAGLYLNSVNANAVSANAASGSPYFPSNILAIADSDLAASNLSFSAQTMEYAITAAGTLSSTQATTTLTETTDDHYVGRIIVWLTGPLIRQVAEITAYNGTTKMLTYSATPSGEAPDEGDAFIIV